MTKTHSVPVFTLEDPIFHGSCKFYIHYPSTEIVKAHRKFWAAEKNDGQVIRSAKGENDYILWANEHESLRLLIATISHECQHLAGMILDFTDAFPKDAKHQESLIRLHDYYFERCLDRLAF